MQSKFFMAMMASVAFGQGLVSQLSDGQPEAPNVTSEPMSLSTTTHTVYTTAVVPAAGSAGSQQKSETCTEGKMPSSYPAVPSPAATTPVAATNGGGSGAPPAGTPSAGGSTAAPAGTPPAGAGGVPGGAPPASYPLGTAPGTSPAAAASNGAPTAPGANSTITAATPSAAGTSVIGSIYPTSPSSKPSGAAGALEPGMGLAAAAALVLGLM